MLTQTAKQALEKQQYRIIGSHSAVKICGWTKNMLRGGGGCYKLKFYGIMSSQCMQMTTSISCANRCTFCWRDYKAPVAREWKWAVDEPEFILENSVRQQHKLLNGFKGSETTNKNAYAKSRQIKHVALSLTGEPITYPRINELMELFNKRGISTFLVTRAQYPEEIKNLKPVTQLYISLNAPTKEIMKTTDRPLFTDYWERSALGLKNFAQKKQRKCLRLTMIKGVNDVYPEKYAELIKKANADFIEIKAYMFVGASRERLKRENMPLHNEIIDFSRQLAKHLPDYEIVTDHAPSRVVMLAKKKFKINNKWHTWIDFEKFNKLVLSGGEFTSEDYMRLTPQTGLSEAKEEDYGELSL